MNDIDWQREMDAEATRNARRRAAVLEDIVDRMIELRDALREAGRYEASDAVGRALDAMCDAREVA